MTDAKTLRIRLHKVDKFITIYDGTRYLVLLGPEYHDAIYYRFIYLNSKRSGITYVISHNYAKIKIDSYVALPL